MSQHRTDYRLWAIATGVIFAGIWIAILANSPDLPNKVMREFVKGIDRVIAVGGELFANGLVYLGIAALVGWVVQASAVACGLRLRGRPGPDQTIDYDDRPHPPTV